MLQLFRAVGRIVQQAKPFSRAGVVELKQHRAILPVDAIGRVAQQEVDVMTIISRARLCGAFAGLAMLIGAMHGHAEAALVSNVLTTNALVSNSLLNNSLTVNALTASGTQHNAAPSDAVALPDLNGVAVEGVVLPTAAHQ
jgi:hypothetical protein